MGLSLKQKDDLKKLRKGWKGKGLCYICGNYPIEPGYTQCSRCRKNHEHWRNGNKEYTKDYQRHKRLGTCINGKRVDVTLKDRKRDHPDRCELCSQDGFKLNYHHWDELNLSKGLWLCIRCHNVAEFMDDCLDPNKYIILKEFVDGCY